MSIASSAAEQQTTISAESEVKIVEEEKKPIVLPTNESSEKLLKIRHTVKCACVGNGRTEAFS